MSNKVLLYSYLYDVERMIYDPEPDLSTQREYTHDSSHLDWNPNLFFCANTKRYTPLNIHCTNTHSSIRVAFTINPAERPLLE